MLFSSDYPVQATVIAAGNIKHVTSCGDFSRERPTRHQSIEHQRKCFQELDIRGMAAVLNQLVTEREDLENVTGYFLK